MDERYKPWHDKAIKSIDYLQEMANRNPDGVNVYRVYPSVSSHDTKPLVFKVWGNVRDWPSYEDPETKRISYKMMKDDPNREFFVLFYPDGKGIEYYNGKPLGSVMCNTDNCIPKPVHNYNFMFEHEQDALDYIAWLSENGLSGYNLGRESWDI